MTADVVQLRDYDGRRPVAGVLRGPAEVVILPVVRVERQIAEIVREGKRHRRSLLEEPA